MDPAANLEIVKREWEAALPSLQDFVRIPNLSIAYDQDWETSGLLERACEHVLAWVNCQGIEGLTTELMKDSGYSPFVVIEIPGTAGSPKEGTTFLMYGHLDKQPHGPGWDPDISPTGGLIKDGKLYGRGASDDGYAVYSCIIAVKALQEQGIAHPRVVIILETCEESGSPHLGHYVEKLAPRFGNPAAVFCMDSSAEDYDTLWLTTTLRGVVMGTLEVGLLKSGLHSGVGGGFVPDAFRVARQLLTRVEDPATGQVFLPELNTKVPVERQEQLKAIADSVSRPDLSKGIPWRPGAWPQNVDDPFAMMLANTWQPCMTVTGFSGLPDPSKAGNVLNTSVKLAISFRIPPLVDPNEAGKAVKEAFESDPPYGATVVANFPQIASPGWNAESLAPNIQAALAKGCGAYFNGRGLGHTGVGATIPLLNMLSDMFPEAGLICTGVLGPGTNLHGPNENLPIEYTMKVTAALAMAMGCLEPEQDSWPEGVPRAMGRQSRRASRRPGRGKRAPRFCFTNPQVPVGQCLCCL